MSRITLSPKRAAAVTAVLGLLSLFPPLATDMYLASLGDLADAMGASHTAAEFSLSIFFLGLCVGQLLVGLLSDGHGRKVPLLVGTALFVVTSVALPLMNDIRWFNALRFVQAIGASAGMVVGRAVVKDLYDGRRAAQVMTVLVMLLTIGPIVSPTLGSLLLEMFGWRSIFAVMAMISAVAFVLSLIVLPETLHVTKRKARPFLNGTRTAIELLTQRSFVTMALVAGCVQGGMFAFITGSSGVFQGIFGLSALGFGLIFALVAAALIVFGKVNGLLLRHYGPEQILRVGLPCFVVSALLLTLVSGTQSLWIFILPLWVSIGMVGLLSANAMSITMEQAHAGAGMGSALLGAMQFAIAFLVSSCVAIGATGSALPMSLGILLPACLATVLFLVSGQRAEQPQSGSAAI